MLDPAPASQTPVPDGASASSLHLLVAAYYLASVLLPPAAPSGRRQEQTRKRYASLLPPSPSRFRRRIRRDRHQVGHQIVKLLARELRLVVLGHDRVASTPHARNALFAERPEAPVLLLKSYRKVVLGARRALNRR